MCEVCSLRSLDGCSGCHCDCNCNDGVIKGMLSLFGIGAGVAGIAYDATARDSGNEALGDDAIDPMESSAISMIARKLGTQTAPEYTPSIILMTFVLLVFAPRIIANLLYALVNTMDGINKDRNLKVIIMVVFFSLPLSILVGGLGGASRWTFTSLAFIFMHFGYRIVVLRHKRVHPELCDLSYLSAAEWRQCNLERIQPENRRLRLAEILKQLLSTTSSLKNEQMNLVKENGILYLVKLFYPAIIKFIARLRLSRDIKAAHYVVSLEDDSTQQ